MSAFTQEQIDQISGLSTKRMLAEFDDYGEDGEALKRQFPAITSGMVWHVLKVAESLEGVKEERLKALGEGLGIEELDDFIRLEPEALKRIGQRISAANKGLQLTARGAGKN